MQWKIEIGYESNATDASGEGIKKDIEDLGISGIDYVKSMQLYILEGNLSEYDVETICKNLLADNITQYYRFKVSDHHENYSGAWMIDIYYKPGVTDAVGESTLKGINDLGIENAVSAKTGKRFIIKGKLVENDIELICRRLLANSVIQDYSISPITTPSPLLNIIGKDGAEMVLIPAGEFQMGYNDGDSDEKPVHTVYLDAFYIDKYEVTNAQYKKFMDATGHRAPHYWNDPNFNKPNQPVVGVTWEDAKAYANWSEKRLPTEAEWEKSARGGLVGKEYVWGDEWPPPNRAGNFGWNIEDPEYIYTLPVGSFNPNGYGLYDMAGNVLEWCADWYGSNYYSNSPKLNPAGPSSGQSRVLRGGTYAYTLVHDLCVYCRGFDDPSDNIDIIGEVGFRCAMSVR